MRNELRIKCVNRALNIGLVFPCRWEPTAAPWAFFGPAPIEEHEPNIELRSVLAGDDACFDVRRWMFGVRCSHFIYLCGQSDETKEETLGPPAACVAAAGDSAASALGKKHRAKDDGGKAGVAAECAEAWVVQRCRSDEGIFWP